jgi:hypothetical protein
MRRRDAAARGGATGAALTPRRVFLGHDDGTVALDSLPYSTPICLGALGHHAPLIVRCALHGPHGVRVDTVGPIVIDAPEGAGGLQGLLSLSAALVSAATPDCERFPEAARELTAAYLAAPLRAAPADLPLAPYRAFLACVSTRVPVHDAAARLAALPLPEIPPSARWDEAAWDWTLGPDGIVRAAPPGTRGGRRRGGRQHLHARCERHGYELRGPLPRLSRAFMQAVEQLVLVTAADRSATCDELALRLRAAGPPRVGVRTPFHTVDYLIRAAALLARATQPAESLAAGALSEPPP